jgi:hypothetical protein
MFLFGVSVCFVRGLRIVYLYNDGFHEDYIVSDELGIEYYT